MTMNHSKDITDDSHFNKNSGTGIPDRQGYLKTIKAKHRINYADTPVKPITNYEKSVNPEQSFVSTWKHLRQLKYVKRLSGIPTIKECTVAEHCYYTGILFEHFAKEENLIITAEEIRWVYVHDLFESVTGDVLYPVKHYSFYTEKCWDDIEKALTEDKELYNYLRWYLDSEAEQRFSEINWSLFKAVDLLELLTFCQEEIALGNHNIVLQTVVHTCIDILNGSNFKSIRSWM